MAKEQKETMKRRHIQTKSAFILAYHDYDLLLNAMSVYLAGFTCKPFIKDEN